MANKIEWLHLPGYTAETWNYFSGCSKISAGCSHCWAEGMSKRMAGRYGYPVSNPFKPTIHGDKLMEPYAWKKPRMVFVTSMGDTFHEDFSFDQIHKMFDVMEAQENQKHLFLILTKRARRMQMFFRDRFKRNQGKIYQNIWAGVSVENQQQANKRLFHLMMTLAHKLFVSAEPLLGAVDLKAINWENYLHFDALSGIYGKQRTQGHKLDWVIVGGESGPHARPMHPGWVRSIRDQCIETATPFFFKQWGAWMQVGVCGNMDHSEYYNHPKCTRLNLAGNMGYHGEKAIYMMKTGKKQAGRALDSKVYSQYPTSVETGHCPVSNSEEKQEDIT